MYRKFVEEHLKVITHSGSEAYCLCPFHQDTRPSFAINTISGLWFCHGCGLKGNLEQLTETLKVELGPTTTQGLREKIEALTEVDENEVRIYPEEWLGQFTLASNDFWELRGIGTMTVKAFQLGFDPNSNSAVIPLRNVDGELLGVIRRALSREGPRYLYPRGFQAAQNLYGSWLIDGDYKALLVEGPIDALACWDAGVPALAIYGSYLSPAQISLLHSVGITKVVIATDNDIAGRKAVVEISGQLWADGIQVGLPTYPHEDAKDPGELSNGEIKAMFGVSVNTHLKERLDSLR